MDNHGFSYLWSRVRCFWYFVSTTNFPVICIYQRIYHIAAMHDALYTPQFDWISAKLHQINQKISGKTNSKNSKNISQPQSLPSLKFAINYREPTYLFCSNKRHIKTTKNQLFTKKTQFFIFFCNTFRLICNSIYGTMGT